MGVPTPTPVARGLGEVLGTFLLVFFGCGAVHAAVLAGAQSGVWQVAVVWGVAIMVAVFVTGGLSGAHLNPAITLALASWGRFSWDQVPLYLLSQLGGAVLAAGALYGLYGPFLEEREKELGLVRGRAGSEMTAMCYGEYFPNPGGYAGPWKALRERHPSPGEVRAFLESRYALVGEPAAFLAELLGTAILALVVFALTDPRNVAAPAGPFAPVFIGLTVAILISVLAPLTQACFNPARDFGPRLVAWAAGWGEVALPGPRGAGSFTVYLLAPGLGAVLGGGLYTRLLRPNLPAVAEVALEKAS